jgi:hypothetical protein
MSPERKARWLREVWRPWRHWLTARDYPTAAAASRAGVRVPETVLLYESANRALIEATQIDERRQRLLEARPPADTPEET